MNPGRLFWPAVAAMLALVGTLEVRSAMGETQTWDEGIHIASGYSYLRLGDYSWNVEHPPLVKIVSALPLQFMGLIAERNDAAGKRKDQVHYGIDFLYKNRRDADSILFAARSPNILLTLLFPLAVAWWTQRRYGAAAGLMAAAMCAFDPNLIAHGRYVTTDYPIAAFFFFACVLWAEYLEENTWRRLLPACAAISLALITKFSAVLLLPPLLILYAACWILRPREFPIRRAAIAAGMLIAVVAPVVLAVYWPETLRCWRTNVPGIATVAVRTNLTGGALYYLGSWLHLPAHAYLFGLNAVAAHNAGGHASYLLGMRSEKGWWYYFPVVFAVKSTIAALLATVMLLAAGLWHAFRRQRLSPVSPMTMGLALPPVLYFVISMTSGINIGMRHILPVYPFIYVGIAALLSGLAAPFRAATVRTCEKIEGTKIVSRQGAKTAKKTNRSFFAGLASLRDNLFISAPLRDRLPPAQRAARYATIALAVLQIGECARITPDYLAFFNELAGGPGSGPEYLVDSNIDWGQDVKKLVHWLDAHGTRRARVFYFGNAQLRYYGVDEMGFPEPLDRQGWADVDEYCVANVTPLQGVYVPLSELAQLRLREPIAKIGWSMYVYDLRKPKAAAAR